MYDHTQDVQGLTLVHSGKVRDTYAVPGHPCLLLIVASDRISTHNIVHETLIPGKGRILTEITLLWMKMFKKMGFKTHLVASGSSVQAYFSRAEFSKNFLSRSMVVHKLDMIPVEFVFRKNLAGSLAESHLSVKPNPYGLVLPKGLQLMSEFPKPLFTPTDKSETDDPVDSSKIRTLYSEAYNVALAAYCMVHAKMSHQGISVIDTKLELGIDPKTGQVVIADECFTTDCSRFVRTNEIVLGKNPRWMDKQHMREEAEKVWNLGPKYPLEFGASVVDKTIDLYQEILEEVKNAAT
jgi:phosphoribosylaminoimidazole-succinocarboxamide synthase